MSVTPSERPDGGAPATGVLSRSTLMTVRRVLHAYREGWLLEERLAAAARMAAADARQHGLAAARMPVANKAGWSTPDAVRRPALCDARALPDRLVTLGIDAYYAYDASPGSDRMAAGPRG